MPLSSKLDTLIGHTMPSRSVLCLSCYIHDVQAAVVGNASHETLVLTLKILLSIGPKSRRGIPIYSKQAADQKIAECHFALSLLTLHRSQRREIPG